VTLFVGGLLYILVLNLVPSGRRQGGVTVVFFYSHTNFGFSMTCCCLVLTRFVLRSDIRCSDSLALCTQWLVDFES
jgi:hypothetical protein